MLTACTLSPADAGERHYIHVVVVVIIVVYIQVHSSLHEGFNTGRNLILLEGQELLKQKVESWARVACLVGD